MEVICCIQIAAELSPVPICHRLEEAQKLSRWIQIHLLK